MSLRFPKRDGGGVAASLAKGSAGGVLIYDAGGNPVELARGADGQLLALPAGGGPPVWAAPAYCSMAANTAAGQVIPSGAATIIVFGTVERDTDAAYNSGTGRYTIPAGKGGDYEVTAAAAYNGALAVAAIFSIYKNAAELKRFTNINPAAGQGMAISATMALAAGDIIDIRTTQASGVGQALAAFAPATYFSIARIFGS